MHFFLLIKSITTVRAGVITLCSPPADLRCSAARDGRFQESLYKQSRAAEIVDWRKEKESGCKNRDLLNNDTDDKKGGSNHKESIASTFALHCSNRRQISRWPFKALRCSGVRWLKKSKRINKCSASRIKVHEINNNNTGGGNYSSFFACGFALLCSNKRQVSWWPFSAEWCSGVPPLKRAKGWTCVNTAFSA